MWEPWDSSDVSTETTETSRSSLEAATEAAARINALLVAKGVLKPSQLSTATTKSTKSSILPAEVRTFYCKLPQWATSQNGNVIIAEVDINNVTLTCRNILTRSSTLEEIAKLTGVTISSRGRFISDDAKVEPGDRPLYLHLQSSSQEAIDNAVARIQKIIDGKDRFIEGSRFNSSCVSSPVQSKPSTSRASSSMAFLEEKLFIGLEHAPPSFDVRGKILGPECSYLHHIQTESGARVLLRGRNSGYFEPDTGREACEPMNIFLEHPATSGLQKAKELAKNLIEMVQEDYVEFQQSLATMLPPPSSAIAQSTATLLAGLQPHSVGTPVGLALVGTSMPSSLSVMPMAAAITAPSPLGFAIGPPVFNPGPTVLLDTSIPPPCVAGSHATSLTLGVMPSSMSSFMVDQTVPPPLGQPIVSLAGSGMMSVQPATSFVLTQPANQPPPGSLVLTQQPSALASGPIVLSQPVSGNPDSYVIAPSGQAPNAIVLSHPAGPQIGQFVHQQLVIPAGAQIAVESTPCSVVTNELSHGQPPLALQTAPVFSQAGGRHVMKPFSQFMLHGQTVSCSNNEMRAPPPVSVVQIASGSQLTMVQPSPSSESSVGGPSAIYTVTVPVSAPVSSQSENCETSTAASCDASNRDRDRDSRKRRFTETEDDFSNLLGYQHGPTHLVNTFVVSSAGTVTSTSTSKDANDSQQAVADAHSVRSSWDRQPVETSFSHIRLSSHGTPLNADEGVQNAVSQSSEGVSEVPVTQYSGQPQLYDLSAALQSQPNDVGLHLLPQDLAVTIYTSSQPASYIYQQTNTVTYRRLFQPSDTLSSYCAPVLSTSQPPSTVFIQDSSLPPPTHYVIPPPPSIVSSVGPQTFTASAALATQFSYAQPLASAGYEVQPPPVYQQSTLAYSGFPVSGISHHSETAYSQMSRIPPPPPPPPSNSTAVSYWMSLS